MTDYKMEAAKAALKVIQKGQSIGLGAGSTIAHLVRLIAAETKLAATLTFVSSSFNTINLLKEHQLKVESSGFIERLDIYFDGCDQFDNHLNALKSGGGIHTSEKILAAVATDFILLGDAGKYVNHLNNSNPLVIEILPQALHAVLGRLSKDFPAATLNLRLNAGKDGAVLSDNGNYLLDMTLAEIPELSTLNTQIKMIPGVVEHSLFYHLATRAIIAGSTGIKVISPLGDYIEEPAG